MNPQQAPTATADRPVADTGRHRGLLARAAICQTIVFLWFAPYTSRYLQDDNRSYFLWEHRDAAALVGCMAVLATGLTGLGTAFRRLLGNRADRWLDALVVLGLAGGILTNLPHHWPYRFGYRPAPRGVEMTVAWAVLAWAVALLAAFRRPGIARTARQACLIMSPAAVLVGLQLFKPVCYRAAMDPIDEPPAAAALTGPADPAPSVFVFMFDMWSYQRTFADGRVRPEYPNIAALAGESLVFHDAHAPGHSTPTSIPRFLFQTTDEPFARAGRVGFEHDGVAVPPESRRSIFQIMSRRGYRTILIGMFLPYAEWLGEGVDICRSYPFYDHGRGLTGRLAVHALGALNKTTDPLTAALNRRLELPLRMRYLAGLHREMAGDIAQVIARRGTPTFALLHYPLPHAPFMYDADGSLREPTPQIMDEHCVQGYLAQLACVDRLVGRWMELMKAAGTYDTSLIVLTSDHTWQGDPARRDGDRFLWEMTHVPLIIRLPGQPSPADVTGRFETVGLMRLIESSIDENARAGTTRPLPMNVRGGPDGPAEKCDAA